MFFCIGAILTVVILIFSRFYSQTYSYANKSVHNIQYTIQYLQTATKRSIEIKRADFHKVHVLKHFCLRNLSNMRYCVRYPARRCHRNNEFG